MRKNNMLYIAAKVKEDFSFSGIYGIYDDEKVAAAVCTEKNDCVIRMILNNTTFGKEGESHTQRHYASGYYPSGVTDELQKQFDKVELVVKYLQKE